MGYVLNNPLKGLWARSLIYTFQRTHKALIFKLFYARGCFENTSSNPKSTHRTPSETHIGFVLWHQDEIFKTKTEYEVFEAQDFSKVKSVKFRSLGDILDKNFISIFAVFIGIK